MNDRCATKYPILLVHGLGARDRKILRYWGRIPRALEDSGARVFYGGQDSWGSIATNAAQIKKNIIGICEKYGYDKVNIIAHSKGGLDCRYMISSLGAASYVASLTTVSTPHFGSKTMDFYTSSPVFIQKSAAFFTNAFFYALGDRHPDMYDVCRALRTDAAARFNARNPDAPGVLYQSYAAIMKEPRGDILMSLPYLVVKRFDGENDGIVSAGSAVWTNFKGTLASETRRGISHADLVDMRRRNLRSREIGRVLDIREFYCGIAEGLKEAGL